MSNVCSSKEQWTTNKGKTWSCGTNPRLPFAVDLTLHLSIYNKNSMTISYRFYPVVRFNSYNSLREFYTAMDSGVYQGGARRMDRALTAASEMLSSRNPESRKTIVLITGGSNSQEAGPGSLEKSVQSLTKLGAKIIIVAFGNRIDAKELLPLVQQQQDIHPVQDASYLTPYVGDLSTIIIFGTSGKGLRLELRLLVFTFSKLRDILRQ